MDYRISKLTPNQQQKRIDRQKKAQAALSITGGTIGLAALGSRFGAGLPKQAAAKIVGGRKIKDLSPQRRYVSGKLHAIKPNDMKEMSNALTATGAGIGGVGAYNFASYTNAEAKQKKKIVKSLTPISKAYFDAERDRMRRADAYQTAALVGAGGLGAASVIEGKRGYKVIGPSLKAQAKNKKSRALIAGKNQLRTVGGHAGKAGIYGLGAAAAGYGAHKIGQKKKGDWAPYAKSASMSAFGVNH